jgi:hypothetical protein
MTIKERTSEEAVEDYKSTSTLDEADVTALEKLYALRGRYQVLGYIEQYPHLMSFLLEAAEKIKEYFPQERLSLNVITDPEIIGWIKLAILIIIEGDIEEVDSQFDRLLEEWWLDIPKPLEELLFLNLEFV